MDPERKCNECGQPIPAEARQALCPHCLFRLGLEAGQEGTEDGGQKTEDRGQRTGVIPVNYRGFFSRFFCRQNLQNHLAGGILSGR